MIELEKYKGRQSRGTCPGCKKPNEFTFYVQARSGERIHETVGRCNRVDRCGYHLTPRQYQENTGAMVQKGIGNLHLAPLPQKELFTIDIERVNDTMCNYPKNSFACCLRDLIGEAAAVELLQRWECIGTSLRYPGAVIYWQVDRHGKVRTGKVMKYKPDFHRDGFTTWTHCGLIPDHQELRQCFFGEHQLTLRPEVKTVCITESEKTAILCSHFVPQFIWMAAGNLQGLNEYKMNALRGKTVILYPDLGAGFTTWTKKAQELRHITEFKVSDLLEKIATPEQRAASWDLADYLIEKELQTI